MDLLSTACYAHMDRRTFKLTLVCVWEWDSRFYRFYRFYIQDYIRKCVLVWCGHTYLRHLCLRMCARMRLKGQKIFEMGQRRIFRGSIEIMARVIWEIKISKEFVAFTYNDRRSLPRAFGIYTLYLTLHPK